MISPLTVLPCFGVMVGCVPSVCFSAFLSFAGVASCRVPTSVP